MAKNDQPCAIVFPIRGNNSYGAIRSLGENGIKVIGLDFGTLSANSFSRYCSKVKITNPLEGEERFLEELISLRSRFHSNPVLFPMDDYCVMLLAKHAERLREHFAYSYLSWDSCRKCVDKVEMNKLCEREGIPLPKTFYPMRGDALEHIIENAPFPCIVKPTAKFVIDNERERHFFEFQRRFNSKALVVADRDDLRKKLNTMEELGMPCIVQELIPGDATTLYSHHFYADAHSHTHFDCVHRKWKQIPADFGTVLYSDSNWDPQAVELGKKFVAAAKCKGIGNMEFKKDPRDGVFKFIEINMRAGSSIYRPTVAGVNIALCSYLDLSGQSIPKSPSQEDGIFFVDHIRCIYSLLKRGPQYDFSFKDFLNLVGKKRVGAQFDWRDPLPFLLQPFQIPKGIVN